MNAVQLTGRIGKDPEHHTFENGNVKTSFSLATSESYKDKEGEWKEVTNWHNIVLYRDTKLRKGDLVSIEGKIATRSYDDKNGDKRYVTEIIARLASLLHRKDNSEQGASKAAAGAEKPANANTETETPDDLPF